MFDLEKFSNHQLTTSVRNSKLFKESCILDVLGKSVLQLEKENKTHKIIDKASAELTSEIWLRIGESHSRYLGTDDCTSSRRDLESFARKDFKT